MEWAEFFKGLGDFIIRVGWRVVLTLSVPVLVWKYMDMKSKQKGKPE